jgi:HAD superfamily hydrolase (TIGR01490 family)
LVWYQRAHLPKWRYFLWAAGLLLQIPHYLWIDRRSRSRLNIVFYRRYAGLNAAAVRAWHHRTFAENFQTRLFPQALHCLENQRRQGRPIVLVTGGLELVMQPLAEHIGAADVIAARLVEKEGMITGMLNGEPIADERKGALVRAYAAQHGIDLESSFGFTDSIRDVSMLECVGHPVAVNPDGRLRGLAQERGWQIEVWNRD